MSILRQLSSPYRQCEVSAKQGSMTEHQVHVFGGVAFLAVLIFGLLRLLAYLDRRGGRPPGAPDRPGEGRSGRVRSKRKKPLRSKMKKRETGDPG